MKCVSLLLGLLSLSWPFLTFSSKIIVKEPIYSPEFTRQIRELEQLPLLANDFPFDNVHSVITDFSRQLGAIRICLREDYWQAMDLILRFQVSDSSFKIHELRNFIILHLTEVKNVQWWSFFFATNRLQERIVRPDYKMKRLDNTTPYIGTFTFAEIAKFLYKQWFNQPEKMSTDAWRAVKPFLVDNERFTSFCDFEVLQKKYEMGVLLRVLGMIADDFELPSEQENKVLALLSALDPTNLNGPTRRRLHLPFFAQFNKLAAEETTFNSLVSLNFKSKLFKEAVNLYYRDGVEGFIHAMLLEVIVHKWGRTSFWSSFTQSVTDLVSLYPRESEPLVYSDYIQRIIFSLLNSMISFQTENVDYYSIVETMPAVIRAIITKGLPFREWPSLSDLPTAFFGELGYLRGDILYVFSQVPEVFHDILPIVATIPAQADLFTLPFLHSQAYIFKTQCSTSLLGQLIQPRSVFQRILQSRPISLVAIENFYLIFKPEMGTFAVVEYTDQPRTVRIELDVNRTIPLIIARIRQPHSLIARSSTQQEFEEFTQIIGAYFTT